MIRHLAALLLVMSTSLSAGQYDAGMPPREFQGNGVAIVVFTDEAGIEQACGKLPSPYQVLACHKVVEEASVIFMPNPCPSGDRERFARLMCHEKGHSLGWPGDHPR